MAERPPQFRMNYGHHLANGLVFAGLGRHVNSSYYHDSSLYNNAGLLTNMAIPATATSGWTYVPELGRWAMAFDGSNDYIIGLPPVTAAPFSMCCWFNAPDVTARHWLISLDNWDVVGDESFHLEAQGAVAGDPIRAFAGHGSYAIADTTASYVANQWQHAAGVFASSSSIIAYLNGQPSATQTALKVPVGIDRLTLGAQFFRSSPSYSTQLIADPIIWSVPRSSSEISELADRSNVMLSGLLIAQPSRNLWPGFVVGGATFVDIVSNITSNSTLVNLLNSINSIVGEISSQSINTLNISLIVGLVNSVESTSSILNGLSLVSGIGSVLVSESDLNSAVQLTRLFNDNTISSTSIIDGYANLLLGVGGSLLDNTNVGVNVDLLQSLGVVILSESSFTCTVDIGAFISIAGNIEGGSVISLEYISLESSLYLSLISISDINIGVNAIVGVGLNVDGETNLEGGISVNRKLTLIVEAESSIIGEISVGGIVLLVGAIDSSSLINIGLLREFSIGAGVIGQSVISVAENTILGLDSDITTQPLLINSISVTRSLSTTITDNTTVLCDLNRSLVFIGQINRSSTIICGLTAFISVYLSGNISCISSVLASLGISVEQEIVVIGGGIVYICRGTNITSYIDQTASFTSYIEQSKDFVLER